VTSPLDHHARLIHEREVTIAHLCARLEYAELRLAALRDEKKRELQRQFGIERCECCDALVQVNDESAPHYGRNVGGEDEIAYACGECYDSLREESCSLLDDGRMHRVGSGPPEIDP
jgi:hypothetical protein